MYGCGLCTVEHKDFEVFQSSHVWVCTNFKMFHFPGLGALRCVVNTLKASNCGSISYWREFLFVPERFFQQKRTVLHIVEMMAPWCRNKNVDSIHLKFRRISLFTRTNKTAPKNFYRSLILLPAPKNLTAPAPALTKPHLKIFTRTHTRTKTAPAPRRLQNASILLWQFEPEHHFGTRAARHMRSFKNTIFSLFWLYLGQIYELQAKSDIFRIRWSLFIRMFPLYIRILWMP